MSESDTIVFDMSEFKYEEQIEKSADDVQKHGAVIGKAVEDIGDRFKSIGEALQTGYELEELPIVQTTQILVESRGKRGWTRKRR